MCTLPDTPGKKRFSSVLWNASGGGGKKFVAINSRRHAAAPIVRLDAQHPRVTAYVHIARQRDLLRQSQDKLDRSSCFHARFNQKIKSAKTYVARFALPFQDVIFLRKSHFQRQHHRKTACGAAFLGTVHQPSRGPLRLRQAITASCLRAMSFTHPELMPGERLRNFRAGSCATAAQREKSTQVKTPLKICPPPPLRLG